MKSRSTGSTGSRTAADWDFSREVRITMLEPAPDMLALYVE